MPCVPLCAFGILAGRIPVHMAVKVMYCAGFAVFAHSNKGTSAPSWCRSFILGCASALATAAVVGMVLLWEASCRLRLFGTVLFEADTVSDRRMIAKEQVPPNSEPVSLSGSQGCAARWFLILTSLVAVNFCRRSCSSFDPTKLL